MSKKRPSSKAWNRTYWVKGQEGELSDNFDFWNVYECIHSIIEYIPSRIPNSNSACLTMMRWDPESWTSDPHDNINVSAILWSGSYIFTVTPPRQCNV